MKVFMYFCIKTFFMNNIFKFIIIYLASFAGLFFISSGLYMLVKELIQPQDLWFQGAMFLGLGITLQMIVLVASTIGNSILLFDEILSQTTHLYELMLQQEKNKSKTNPMSGMFNSITIKNPNTGEETTTPLNSSNIADSLNDINKAIIDSIMKGPQESFKPKKRGRKKNLENMNLGELEAQLAEAIKKDDYEKASEISAHIENLKNPPPEEKKED